MDTAFKVSVRMYRLSAELQPFFTALYKFNIACPADTEIEDCLHPEWASLRFTCGPQPVAAIGKEPMEAKWPFVASGPTSKAIRFRLTTSRIWGLGLQPAGWARFMNRDASEFTDRSVDGCVDQTFALFAPILRTVQELDGAPDQIAEDINEYLMRHIGPPDPRLEPVFRLHEALRDPEVAHVAELGERVGVGLRTVERLSLRYFGFPPKLLLRRQRFLRSLARYMLMPGSGWSQSLDSQYHDQAQFVRDFRSFMGVTPTEYAEMPHPILDRIVAQRMADIGAAPETDLPTVLRYRPVGGGTAENEPSE